MREIFYTHGFDLFIFSDRYMDRSKIHALHRLDCEIIKRSYVDIPERYFSLLGTRINSNFNNN